MAVRPRTDVIQRLVTIRTKPAVRQVVPIPQVLVLAALTRFLTAAAELAKDVRLAAIHLLRIGALITDLVTVTAVPTEHGNLVMNVVAVLAAVVAVRPAAVPAAGADLHVVLAHLTPADII